MRSASLQNNNQQNYPMLQAPKESLYDVTRTHHQVGLRFPSLLRHHFRDNRASGVEHVCRADARPLSLHGAPSPHVPPLPSPLRKTKSGEGERREKEKTQTERVGEHKKRYLSHAASAKPALCSPSIHPSIYPSRVVSRNGGPFTQG